MTNNTSDDVTKWTSHAEERQNCNAHLACV